MKVTELCNQIIEKALANKELTLTKADLNEYNPDYIRNTIGRVLKGRNLRHQFTVTLNGLDSLIITNRNYDGSSQLSGSQQVFTSIITTKHSSELISAYVLLVSSGILETVEIQGVTPEDLTQIYGSELADVETIPTQKGTLIL